MEQTEMQQILQAITELSYTMDKRFNEVDEKFIQVDKRFEQIDQRFDKMETRLDRIEKKMDKSEENISFLFSEVGSNSLQIKKLISSN